MLLKGYINDGPEHRLAIETLLGRLGKAAKQVASDLFTVNTVAKPNRL